jgi:hypothetical protein
MATKNIRSDMNPLGLEPHHGCAVTAVGVTISNAGGGLHDPLEVDSDMIGAVANVKIGDTVYFLIRADCNGDGYKPIKGAEDRLRYIPSFHATDTTIVEEAWAVEKINDQRDKVARLQEEAEGKQRLPFDAEHGGLSIVGGDNAE